MQCKAAREVLIETKHDPRQLSGGGGGGSYHARTLHKPDAPIV